MVRIIVDTNVVFSGIVFSGPEARVLDSARSGYVHLLIPDYVVCELCDVVSRKAPAFRPVLERFLNENFITRLPPPPYSLVLKAQQIIRDPKDSVILASALDAKPDYLITGDKDFHTEEVKAVVRVATAGEIIQSLDCE